VEKTPSTIGSKINEFEWKNSEKNKKFQKLVTGNYPNT
jgi:hypothetical protein